MNGDIIIESWEIPQEKWWKVRIFGNRILRSTPGSYEIYCNTTIMISFRGMYWFHNQNMQTNFYTLNWKINITVCDVICSFTFTCVQLLHFDRLFRCYANPNKTKWMQNMWTARPDCSKFNAFRECGHRRTTVRIMWVP